MDDFDTLLFALLGIAMILIAFAILKQIVARKRSEAVENDTGRRDSKSI